MGKGELRASIELVEEVFYFPEGMHIIDAKIVPIAGGLSAGGYDELIFTVEHEDIQAKEPLPQIQFIYQSEHVKKVSLKEWKVCADG